MTNVIEFIPEKIKIMKINNKSMECLFYALVTEDGEYISGSCISLNKCWFKPSLGPKPCIGKWIDLKYYQEENKYGFYDPEDFNGKPYTLYKEIINMVDYIVEHIVEKEVLGCNQILDLNNERFYVQSN